MKNYYLILIENFIGIGYLTLFLIGFFTNTLNLLNIGGIGMILFMLIMIKEMPKNLFSFLFMCGIGSIIGYLISKWWLGLFWVSAIFTAGQLSGIIVLIKYKRQLIEQVEELKIVNHELLKFAMTGKTTDPDKLAIIEVLLFIGLIIGPCLITNVINIKMQILLYIAGGLSGIMGFFILLTASEYKYSHLGLTFGGLSYLIGGILAIYQSNWWFIIGAWILAFGIRKIFGDPT